MKKTNYYNWYCKSLLSSVLLLLLVQRNFAETVQRPPKLTVILVVDQLPYWQFERLSTHFKQGFKTLKNEGINYLNIYYPYARPGTAAGHTGMQTGVTPKDHGIVNNYWITPEGTKVHAFSDPRPQATVLNPSAKENPKTMGYSAASVMVKGISDQFIQESSTQIPHHVVALSLKPRSSVACSSGSGKAIWFDTDSGLFTTSKAYFDTIPAWLSKFNANHYLLHKKELTWNLAYPHNYSAYTFHNSKTYHHVQNPKGMVNSKISMQKLCSYKHPEHCQQLLLLTPFANQLILDLAEHTIRHYTSKHKPDELLLWVCIGATDKIGHKYGPDSRETIDMLYHLDIQIGNFIKKVQNYLCPQDVLFVLTSDHGAAPLPELQKTQGTTPAHRTLIAPLINNLNKMLATYNPQLATLVTKIKLPSLYLNNAVFNTLTTVEQEKVLEKIKEFLCKQPGIKQAWTAQELQRNKYPEEAIETMYKNQLFAGRSGPIQIQIEPNCFLTESNTGIEHQSPYEYDTHVPFIIYRPCVYPAQTISDKGWTLQLANTLANILHVSKPATSPYNALPPFGNQSACGARTATP